MAYLLCIAINKKSFGLIKIFLKFAYKTMKETLNMKTMVREIDF